MTGVRGSAGLRPRPSLWVLWPTFGATWIAFAQVLSFQGLVLWVVGGSLLGGSVVGVLASYGRPLLALVAMVVLPIVVAGATEIVGGTTAGPITRSSLMATAVAGAMGLLLNTRWPASMVLPSLFLLGGALGLGAAEDVLWLSGLWAVAAAATLAMLGPLRNEHLRDRARLAPFALLLVGLGLVAVVATVSLSFFLHDPWTIPGATSVSAPVSSQSTPPPAEAQTSVEEPVSVTPPEVESSSAAEARDSVVVSVLRLILFALALALLMAIVVVVIWRLLVGLRWWWVRRRLRSGSPSDRVVGAWTWLRLQRARWGLALPAYASPDVATVWARKVGEPDVLAVAEVVALVAYDPLAQVDRVHARACWQAARRAARARPGSWRQRIRCGFTTPSRVRARLGASGGGLGGSRVDLHVGV